MIPIQPRPVTPDQLRYLAFQKVFPRENYHDNKVHNFYIYCYLNPFKRVNTKYYILGQNYEFGYEPVYVGKASSAHGYRHNQHIAEFLRGQDSEEPYNQMEDSLKQKVFREIEEDMKINTNPNLPSNWDEYQKNWIIIISSFNTAQELIQAEKEIIQAVGVQYKETGPLVNAILG